MPVPMAHPLRPGESTGSGNTGQIPAPTVMEPARMPGIESGTKIEKVKWFCGEPIEE